MATVALIVAFLALGVALILWRCVDDLCEVLSDVLTICEDQTEMIRQLNERTR